MFASLEQQIESQAQITVAEQLQQLQQRPVLDTMAPNAKDDKPIKTKVHP